MKLLLFEDCSSQTTDCVSPRLLGRVITEKLVASSPREHFLEPGIRSHIEPVS